MDGWLLFYVLLIVFQLYQTAEANNGKLSAMEPHLWLERGPKRILNPRPLDQQARASQIKLPGLDDFK